MERDEVRAAGSWVIPVNALFGLAVIACAFVMPKVFGGTPTSTAFWNDLVSGVIVVACSRVAMLYRTPAPFWVQCAIGAWLLIAPSLLGPSFVNEGLADMFFGMIIALMGLSAAVQRSATRGTPNRV